MIERAADTESHIGDMRGRKLGEFVLREPIGHGGFASVYRCEQTVLGREAVVKVLHPTLRTSDQVLQRFLREAQLASRLDHPYAAHVYAFGVEPSDKLMWIAMELVQGISLRQWLIEHGAMPLDQLINFFQGVAEVVQTAHERGIVHRDLKPSNVMVIERAGRLLPKLLDFGIAKLIDDVPLRARALTAVVTVPELPPSDVPSDPQLTQTNMTLGSPPYMSPEQWLDPSTVGRASDLYSLGIMAFEALTGMLPFMASTPEGFAMLHCNVPVPSLGPDFPPQLDQAFQRVLAKLPEQRPATALAFVNELRDAGAAVSAQARAATERPRRRAWPWVLAVSVIAIAIVSVLLVLQREADTPKVAAPTIPAPAPVEKPAPAPAAPPSPAVTQPTPEPPPQPAASAEPERSTPVRTKRKRAVPRKTESPPKVVPTEAPPEDFGANRL